MQTVSGYAVLQDFKLSYKYTRQVMAASKSLEVWMKSKEVSAELVVHLSGRIGEC